MSKNSSSHCCDADVRWDDDGQSNTWWRCTKCEKFCELKRGKKEIKKYPRKWEHVIREAGIGLLRLRVPGGWHVLTEKSLIHYPDPNYEWVLEEESPNGN